MTDAPKPTLRDIDPWIALPALALLAIGVANLHALDGTFWSARGLASRQALWIALGLCAGAWTWHLARTGRHRALSWAHALGALAVLACLAGFHEPLRGVRRWMRLGPLVVQPSELLKLGVAAALARWFGDAPLGTRTLSRAAAGVLALVALPAAMVAAQPDLGTAALLVAIAASTLLVTPRAARSLALLALTTAAPLVALPRLLLRDYQLARLRHFLDPSRDSYLAWQPSHAREALAAGRWFGAEPPPPALSVLPDVHTDFALVAWADLHGAAALALALGLYAALALRAFDTARRATDRYDVALATGAGAMVLWQAALNAAMVTGLAPVVGVGAPLVSYGGSNLVVTLAALGAVAGIRARVEREAAPLGAPGPERIYRGAPE